jgi:hypothetical protein
MYLLQNDVTKSVAINEKNESSNIQKIILSEDKIYSNIKSSVVNNDCEIIL